MPSHGSVTKAGKCRMNAPGSNWPEHLAKYDEWRKQYGEHAGRKGRSVAGVGKQYSKSPKKPPHMCKTGPKVHRRQKYRELLKEEARERLGPRKRRREDLL